MFLSEEKVETRCKMSVREPAAGQLVRERPCVAALGTSHSARSGICPAA